MRASCAGQPGGWIHATDFGCSSRKVGVGVSTVEVTSGLRKNCFSRGGWESLVEVISRKNET